MPSLRWWEWIIVALPIVMLFVIIWEGTMRHPSQRSDRIPFKSDMWL